ncbi:hypothetical protein [Aquimarina muelleri]|uniref:Uncharacterized protein n=1 Tax=Aquimarina muelleri TaxID=279356 RepID=A0A918JVX2_9FLAO|nr:hypothetical protein [Aquimarina muelleri]MCX2764537.1 hypothetical protein [Aquimarina muelleri]GGX22915.1 hypothetical protein GCM10007384_25110 [Aquimarina muelleri]
MNTNEIDNKFIELKELSGILKASSVRVAINWCKQMDIPIFVIANKTLTYRFLVNAELDKRIVSLFKKRYPEYWDKLYQCYLNNESVEFAMTLETKMEKARNLEVCPKSEFAKSFLADPS